MGTRGNHDRCLTFWNDILPKYGSYMEVVSSVIVRLLYDLAKRGIDL